MNNHISLGILIILVTVTEWENSYSAGPVKTSSEKRLTALEQGERPARSLAPSLPRLHSGQDCTGPVGTTPTVRLRQHCPLPRDPTLPGSTGTQVSLPLDCGWVWGRVS